MSSANYKNKHMRQRAIEAIMQAMGREDFGVTEVKQKIKNIRSTYNQEDTEKQSIRHFPRRCIQADCEAV
jgi:hypothetical protein